jgi:hypothetical protein
MEAMPAWERAYAQVRSPLHKRCILWQEVHNGLVEIIHGYGARGRDALLVHITGLSLICCARGRDALLVHITGRSFASEPVERIHPTDEDRHAEYFPTWQEGGRSFSRMAACTIRMMSTVNTPSLTGGIFQQGLKGTVKGGWFSSLIHAPVPFLQRHHPLAHQPGK